MPDNALKEETARWLQYAHDDLASAELLHASEFSPPRHVCLFAQQAAEKALKSALIWLEISVTKTHDIVFLQRALPKGWRIYSLPDQDLNALAHWAVDSRYPGEEPDASHVEAQASLVTASKVLGSIEADLAASGFNRQ